MKGLKFFSRIGNKWKLSTCVLGVVVVLVAGIYIYRYEPFRSSFEITDELGGNIFPVTILSTATTDANLIVPADTGYIGNSKSCIAVRIKSTYNNSKLRVEVDETPFFSRSVSEFILPEAGKEYTVFPDIVWNYNALRENEQAVPVSVSMHVELNKRKLSGSVHTFSVRSINECLLGYIDSRMKFHDTGEFFAAYVNEDNPKIDQLLREALNTRIVNRFWGYQGKSEDIVDKQVYALWYVLQKRNFKYSSISNSSLSSNVVFTQRVRTFDDALQSAQINCVDGSVLFASLLKAINIDPILVRIPGHMFVGYYTDRMHRNMHFLETSMIGDVNLDDFFPEEKLDSTVAGKSQESVSRLMFDKSKEYATRIYKENEKMIHSGKLNYMFLEIDKATRAYIQPIGK
ncbi:MULTISPECIES: hypothetical protein [unclassified Phocaeicola]|jgi:hypothetical protein|uniref:hypothetical protein n=1 Tax=unclassified Phocaeicola TaxID=2762211 RepID=UPI00033EE682|nr:uncharacterized protein BN461_01670 [Bacteroides sp. CAG:1076]